MTVPTKETSTRSPERDDSKHEQKPPPPTLSRRDFIGRMAILATAAAADRYLSPISSKEDEDQSELAGTSARSAELLVDPQLTVGFLGEYDAIAYEVSQDAEMPVPYEVILAVAMHESDSGKSELARNANNFFGVVAKDGWEGETYIKRTEEQVPKSEWASVLEGSYGENPEVLYEIDGSSPAQVRIAVDRSFRKYDSPEESFQDFVKKLYFQESDGSYRYADARWHMLHGENDPETVVDLLIDSDEPGELRYATGGEWADGVKKYINVIELATGFSSGGLGGTRAQTESGEYEGEDLGGLAIEVQGILRDVEDIEEFPQSIEGIDPSFIDLSSLSEAREQSLKSAFEQALSSMGSEGYRQFLSSKLLDKSRFAEDMAEHLDRELAEPADISYDAHYKTGIDPSNLEYIVLHSWGNGVKDYTGDGIPEGSSNQMKLEDQVQSWFVSGNKSSAAYLVGKGGAGDSPDGHEVWRLTRSKFAKTNHVGNGLQDEARFEHSDVNNSNSVGIEIQANTALDIDQEQIENTIYLLTHLLFESGKLKVGMARSEVEGVVSQTVVGHGKANGLEMGQKYTGLVASAVAEFAYVAVSSDE